MVINYLTLFPEVFPVIHDTSILGRARDKKIVDYQLIDIRDYTEDAHHTVDDKAFGGEPGMVMKVEPLDGAIEATKKFDCGDSVIILTDAAGEPFNQEMALELSKKSEITFICGRYKGVDERIKMLHNIRPVSIGDYVITGGELAALVISEAVVRLIDGVIGDIDSAISDSHYDGFLSCPVYTRPMEYKGHRVPEVLLSGNHTKIAEWRKAESLKRTERLRPDLYHKYIGNS